MISFPFVWNQCCSRNPPIQPLTQVHYSDVCKIFEKAFDTTKFPIHDLTDIWNERTEQTCGYFIYNRLVAFAIVVEIKKINYLYFFGVEPKLRGKGIGSKMLKHILEKVSSIYLWPISDRLKKWYESHGFYHSSSGFYVFNTYTTRSKKSMYNQRKYAFLT